MSVLISVQTILPLLAAVIPGAETGLELGQTTLEQYHSLLITQYAGLKAEILHDVVTHGGTLPMRLTMLPLSSCPSGQSFQKNGIIQTIDNLNGFIFAFGYALVPTGFILGLILYIYGWNENVKGWGRRCMIGAILILAGIIGWTAITGVVSSVVSGSCAPS